MTDHCRTKSSSFLQAFPPNNPFPVLEIYVYKALAVRGNIVYKHLEGRYMNCSLMSLYWVFIWLIAPGYFFPHAFKGPGKLMGVVGI